MWVPVVEVRLVEGTYEDIKNTVSCGPGMSGDIEVNVGLRRGAPRVHRYLIVVEELKNRKIGTTDIYSENYCKQNDTPRIADRVERHALQTRPESRLE